MVPGDPGETAPVGRQARRTQEIGALDQHGFGRAGVERQRNDRGLGVGRRAAAMVLAHGENAAAGQIELEIGVAAAFGRRDFARAARRCSISQTEPSLRSL